jgi:hypothetical protein
MELNYVDLLMLLVSAAAVIISIIAIRLSKGNIETFVMQQFFIQYHAFNNVVLEYKKATINIRNMSGREKAFWHEKYRYAYEEYYNTLEYMCAKYLSREINRSTFERVMRDEIERIYSDSDTLKIATQFNSGKEHIDERWPCIRDVYNKMFCK